MKIQQPFSFRFSLLQKNLENLIWPCSDEHVIHSVYPEEYLPLGPSHLYLQYGFFNNQIPHWVLGLALAQYTIQLMQILININRKILVKSRKYFQIIKAYPINHCVMTVCPTNFDWRRKMQKISFLYCESTRVVQQQMSQHTS